MERLFLIGYAFSSSVQGTGFGSTILHKVDGKLPSISDLSNVSAKVGASLGSPMTNIAILSVSEIGVEQ